MAIRKYKFHRIIVILNKALPRQYLDLEISSSFRSQGGREEKKKKKERKKDSSSPHRLRFIGHPLSTSRTRYSNAFSPLFFTRSLLFRDIGLTLAPATQRRNRKLEDPPRHPGATPIEHHSSLSLFSSPSPSTIVTSLSLSLYDSSRVSILNISLENIFQSSGEERRFVFFFFFERKLSQFTIRIDVGSIFDVSFEFSFQTPD